MCLMKCQRVMLRVDGCGGGHHRRGSGWGYVVVVVDVVGGGEWMWVNGQKRRLMQRVLFQPKVAVVGVPQYQNRQKKVKTVVMTPCLNT